MYVSIYSFKENDCSDLCYSSVSVVPVKNTILIYDIMCIIWIVVIIIIIIYNTIIKNAQHLMYILFCFDIKMGLLFNDYSQSIYIFALKLNYTTIS